ncbi:DUF222 domain-containing protein, partial [Arthrobacter sp. APC 3897]
MKARRLREKTYPETIPVRHRTAFEARRVCLVPDEDGMSWLSALLPAARAQLIFTQLSTAARGEQSAGDPRGVDQLRADILADLLEGDPDVDDGADTGSRGRRQDETPTDDDSNCYGRSTPDGQASDGQASDGQASDGRASAGTGHASAGSGPAATSEDDHSRAAKDRVRARTEILVLITAETLFGADEQPAELHGYGPISPETARRLAREAARWT